MKGIYMKKRILSGMRPTGNLHLGHLVGALENWAKLQEEYKCFYMVADWHAVTTGYQDNLDLKKLSIEIIAEWIACGIDPEKSILFVQSAVKQHAELHLLLSMITPLAWVERNPSFKEIQSELKNKDISTYGFLGYPVLQAADIIIYNADGVPVGVDQLPHVELCREIVRRFHNIYGEVFKEPKTLLTEVPKLAGLDNRKMSKSYNNCIYLSDTGKTLRTKVFSMITDPARQFKTDKGNPEVCNLFNYQKVFNPADTKEISEQCKSAGIGCVDCKKKLYSKLQSLLDPISEKRNELLKKPDYIFDIINEGNKTAEHYAEETMKLVRSKMMEFNKNKAS